MECGVDAAQLNLRSVVAAGLESPRFGRSTSAVVVTDLCEEEFLSTVCSGEFFQLSTALLPGCGNFFSVWIDAFGQRKIGEHADVIERIPEPNIVIFVPICAVSHVAVINFAHRADNFAPTICKLLCVGK